MSHRFRELRIKIYIVEAMEDVSPSSSSSSCLFFVSNVYVLYRSLEREKEEVSTVS